MNKAHELCLGNKVFNTAGQVIDVTVEVITDVALNLRKIEFIPLTRDLLIEFGFTPCKNGIQFDVAEGIAINSLFSGFPLTLDLYDGSMRAPLRQIKYLHQLQNLINSLSNNESNNRS